MSLQNFPKIPKITLRKPGDQSKDTKNEVQKNVTETKDIATHLRSGNDVLHVVCAVVPVRGGRFVAPRHMFFVKITF